MEPIDVVRRIYEAANRHDLEAIPGIFAADFYSHPMRTTGLEPIREAWRTIMQLYPGLRVEPVEIIATGDRVAVWARVHHGQGEPATMMELIRVADDRVAEVWGLSTLKRG